MATSVWSQAAVSLAAPVVPPPQPAPASEATTIVVLPPPPDVEVDPAPFRAAIADNASSVGLDAAFANPSPQRPFARALGLSDRSDTLCVFWIERRATGLAIYLYEPRVQGVFIREIPRGPEETDAALVESVGLIVASTSAALREGRELGMQPVDPAQLDGDDGAPDEPSPDPEDPGEADPTEPDLTEPDPSGQGRVDEQPPSDEAPGSGVAGRLVLAYVGDGFNARAPWQSGLRVGVGVVPHRLVRVGLGYGHLFAASVGGTPPLRLARHEVGLDVGIGGALTDRVTLHGTALVAASLARWSSDGRTGLRPLVRAGPLLELGIRLVADLHLDVGAGLVGTLNRVDFVVCDAPDADCTGAMRRVVASAWPVAPRATLGLSYLLRRRARP